MPGNTAYCLSKGGMRMLTRTAGVELAPHNILVVGVGPGAVDTPINAATVADPEGPGQAGRRHPASAGWPSPRRSPAWWPSWPGRGPATSRPPPSSPTAASCSPARALSGPRTGPMDGDVVSAERVIPAPPEAIFDLLADAARHPEFDGSGQLRGVKSGDSGAPGPRRHLRHVHAHGHGLLDASTRSSSSRRTGGSPGSPRPAGPLGPVPRRPHLALRARAGRGRDPGPGELGHLAGPPAAVPPPRQGGPFFFAARTSGPLRVPSIRRDSGRSIATGASSTSDLKLRKTARMRRKS